MKRIVCIVVITLAAVATLFAGGAQEGGAEGAATTTAAEEKPYVAKDYPALNVRTGEITTVEIGRINEAPELSELVAKGELPPVEERISEEPLVLEPLERIGKYGGTIVQARIPAYLTTLSRRLQREFLLNFSNPYLVDIIPNVAKDWTMNDDATQFTFYLREGMKWSDGEPFTTDDIIFWYEAIIKNDELYPSKDSRMMSGGELGLVRKVDDYTVTFTFLEPNPMFLENMAFWRPEPYAPAHYLEQFHPDYTAEADVKKAMQEAGFDTWADFFQEKNDQKGNPDCPVIAAWYCINDPEDEIHRFVRNPYYWKLDTEGNQLPYIGEREHPFVQTNEAWTLLAMAGDLTYAQSHFIGMSSNYPMLMENRDRGNYDLHFMVPNPFNNVGYINFNFAHEDPTINQLLNDRRFRIALSISLNREEINEIIFDGYAEPFQTGTPPGPPFYPENNEIFKRFLEYDPDRANELLDEIGLTERDREGFRLGPDGEKLTLINLTSSAWPVETPEMIELYKQHWEKVGLRIVNKVQASQLVTEMRNAGDFMILTGATNQGGRPFNFFTRGALMPVSRGWGISPPWGTWLVTNGEEGVEPPAPVKRLREIYELGMVEPSQERRNELVEEAFDITTENLYGIGMLQDPKIGIYFLFKNDLHNFKAPDTELASQFQTHPPAMWFFE